MSYIGRGPHSSAKAASTTSYISIRTFNNDFFSYTTTTANFVTTGALGPVVGATAANCVQGRILTETGRRLYPGANPGIKTLMVGVFDYATGLNGFIDPNSTAIVPQNTERPYYFTSPGSNTVDQYANRAPPVFTRGNIFGQSNLDISGSAHIYSSLMVKYGATIYNGETVYGTETVYGNQNVYGSETIQSTLTTSTMTVNTGKLNLPSGIVGVATMNGGITAGSFKKLTVLASGCTASSRVFLTYLDQNGSGILSAEEITNGQFKIVSSNTSDVSTVQWLIIN